MKELKQIFIFIFSSFSFYLIILFLITKIKIGKYEIVYSVVDGSVLKGDDTYLRFKEFDENGKYDLVVLGSSHAYRGYDVKNFETKLPNCYNLGSSSQQIKQTYIIAKSLINSNNTKRVIVEVYPHLFFKHTNEIESASFLVANLKQTALALSIAFDANDLRIYNQFFIRLLKTFDEPIALTAKDKLAYYKGYCSNSDSLKNPIKAKINFAIRPKNYNKIICDKSKIEALDKLLQYLKLSKVNVVVCTHFAPLEANKYVHDLFTPIIKNVCLKNRVSYLDYSYNHSEITEHSFYDFAHLNKNGVKAYNQKLIYDLDKMNFFDE